MKNSETVPEFKMMSMLHSTSSGTALYTFSHKQLNIWTLIENVFLVTLRVLSKKKKPFLLSDVMACRASQLNKGLCMAGIDRNFNNLVN